MRPSLTILAWAASIVPDVTAAVPTWPSSIDELEDIQQLNSGYRARAFSAKVTPCSLGAGVGRIAAAEWLRTAFHDMATGNVVQGTGGMDASLQYELAGDGGENIGTAFNTTLTTFTPFLSSRSSLADIIAMGVYTSVRSCGGPVVPMKGGRIDAKTAGTTGVPLPQNSLFTFEQQFARMGFSTTEMIQVVACGHTIGGVHSANFPQVVAPPTIVVDFESTPAVFDEKIASEFSTGTPTDPLTVGISGSSGRDSDKRIFQADGNVTIKSMADPATFQSTCATVLQKMIELVPAGVTLTTPITPYDVKPNNIQLTLLGGGTNIQFTGEIRVRTTVQPASQIASVVIVYKDRTGATGGTITSQVKGTAAGFDDTYTFYGFTSQLSSTTSISAFNVLLTLTSGGTVLYDNNGVGFPVQDTIMVQTPQSCLNGNNLTIVAAIRNTAPTAPANMNVTLKVPRSCCVVPALTTVSVAMTQQSTVGSYSLYAASYTMAATDATAKFSVAIGSFSDSFKNVADLGTKCAALDSNSTSNSSTYSYQGCFTDSTASRAFTGAASDNAAMTVETCAASCSNFQFFGVEYGDECYCGNKRANSSVQAGASDCNMACAGNSQEICGAGNRLSVFKNTNYVSTTNPSISGYIYQGCYSDSVTDRSLSGSATASDTLTVETCATFCNGATYFGVEYGRECYCGPSLGAESIKEAETDCSMACSGNSTEFCGAGNRLSVYKKTSNSTTTSTTSSTTTSGSTTSKTTTTTTTTSASPTATGWSLLGCYTDSVGARTLSVNMAVAGGPSNMSHEVCTAACQAAGYTLSGVEYSAECYCDTQLRNGGGPAPDGNAGCNMVCNGNATEICGGSNRLSLYGYGAVVQSSSSTVSTSMTSSSTTTTTSKTTTSSSTIPSLSAGPTLSGYGYQGCYTDNPAARVLTGKSTSTSFMTYASCGTFCGGYAYFGVEYSTQCYCGDSFANPTALSDSSTCSMACSGDAAEMCGGAGTMNLFKNNNPSTAPSNPAIAGYTYASCHTDSPAARVLTASRFTDSAMTVERCATFCAGSTYFGTEYGVECYCGNAFTNPTSVSTESDCSFVCGGDSGELCGAGDRLSLYQAN